MKLLILTDNDEPIREFNLNIHTEDILYPGGAPSIIGRRVTDDLVTEINAVVQEDWKRSKYVVSPVCI